MSYMETPQDYFLGKFIRGYKLEQLLGRGSVTAVYRARTTERWQIPEIVATLFLLPDTLTSQENVRFRSRFHSLAQQLTQYDHPHILSPFGYGEQDNQCYLLMAPVNGQNLCPYLSQKERLSPIEVVKLLEPIVSALEYLNQQSPTFQFFQPSNVVLSDEGQAQITGIGLIQLLAGKGLSDQLSTGKGLPHLKNIVGTYQGKPEYLAPEVVKGADGDLRSDVYALGIFLFELLSGQPPFTGSDYEQIARKHVLEPLPSLHTVCPDIPIALELVVNHALHRDPNQRFQTPKELFTALMQVLNQRVYAPTHIPLLETIEKLRPALPPGPTTLRIAAPPSSRSVHPTVEQHDLPIPASALSVQQAPFDPPIVERLKEEILQNSHPETPEETIIASVQAVMEVTSTIIVQAQKTERVSGQEEQHLTEERPVEEIQVQSDQDAPSFSFQMMMSQIQQQREKLETYYKAAVPRHHLHGPLPKPREAFRHKHKSEE